MADDLRSPGSLNTTAASADASMTTRLIGAYRRRESTAWITEEMGACQQVIHCSGADSAATLQPVCPFGAVAGSMHPLQTFANCEQAIINIPGSTFAIEAEETLQSTLKEMAVAIGGRWIVLRPEDRALYHASAVMACNYLVTLIKMSTDLWQKFGIPPEESHGGITTSY